MTAFRSPEAFAAALAELTAPDDAAIAAARARQAQLTKPAGSLGRLEDVAVFLAAWQQRERPVLECARAVIFAGNHGVTAQGVSAFPASVTMQMVENFRQGGAAINALSGASGLELSVVPIALDRPTADFMQAPAMSEDECLEALNLGAKAVADRPDLIVVGEMGIGNSTAAAALCARSFGGPASAWTGPGTGLADEGVARKIAVVEAAVRFHADAPATAFESLRRVGGREIAAIAGAVLHARRLRVPVVLDGFITGAAIAPLFAQNPRIVDHCIAGHRSAEPGHVRLLAAYGLEPLLTLGMRLGEGSGGALAVGIIRAALAAHQNMATFAEAQVAGAL